MLRFKALAGLAGWILACFAAGLFGSQFRPGPWYADLVKPNWTPPNWIFGPVWSLLYLMMGIAAWRVWRQGGFAGQRAPLLLFLAQLVLNAAWSWIFFGLRRPDLALVEILVLWSTILATLMVFYRIRCWAALLLVPYLGWVTFAAALNHAVWRLNS
jgi:tryptophan-rich sensory protein